LSLKKSIREWIKNVFNDYFVIRLLNNSYLTRKQLETILIDILAENFCGKKLTYEVKAQLVTHRKSLTRGAFNRTLRQARRNIIRSIYTIILLGYLGILESPNLYPYMEIANKIEKYLKSYKDIYNRKELVREEVRILKVLREELEDSLQNLSNPLSLSKKE